MSLATRLISAAGSGATIASGLVFANMGIQSKKYSRTKDLANNLLIGGGAVITVIGVANMVNAFRN
ncbi:hypothetical protein MZD04_gp131 [Pseudomonas phage Psa21]|uniref:Uncharacterized protein n=1 Tax=Pseudomonas phage Psa21 TaxID=2530023 RepID=A0A481W4T5_9CAUD|nr:hypothetical protein MZD04_gp131 [Pseudomonas phage Psa21]QBJ02658.1 hypothetical protein PSA21_131 [Pseudomonas phage Psa21]